MLSYQLSWWLHVGQREGGCTTESPSGTRWMTTLRKLPMMVPKKKAIRVVTARGIACAHSKRIGRLGLPLDCVGAKAGCQLLDVSCALLRATKTSELALMQRPHVWRLYDVIPIAIHPKWLATSRARLGGDHASSGEDLFFRYPRPKYTRCETNNAWHAANMPLAHIIKGKPGR